MKADSENEPLAREDHPYAEQLGLRAAFNTLNEMEKTVISLMVFAGYNSRETAKILNSREGTIRSAKSRAFTKMSQYLKEDFV